MHGITVNCENRVLEVTLPCLLPKRKQRQSDEFLLDPLYFVLDQYAREHPLPYYRDCVVCFAQVYDRALPDRRIRDYDNLSEKQLLDLLSSFVMLMIRACCATPITRLNWATRIAQKSTSWRSSVFRNG